MDCSIVCAMRLCSVGSGAASRQSKKIRVAWCGVSSTSIIGMAARLRSVDCDEVEAALGCRLQRSRDGINRDNRHAVGAVDHEHPFTMHDGGAEIDHLLHSEMQQLL